MKTVPFLSFALLSSGLLLLGISLVIVLASLITTVADLFYLLMLLVPGIVLFLVGFKLYNRSLVEFRLGETPYRQADVSMRDVVIVSRRLATSSNRLFDLVLLVAAVLGHFHLFSAL